LLTVITHPVTGSLSRSMVQQRWTRHFQSLLPIPRLQHARRLPWQWRCSDYWRFARANRDYFVSDVALCRGGCLLPIIFVDRPRNFSFEIDASQCGRSRQACFHPRQSGLVFVHSAAVNYLGPRANATRLTFVGVFETQSPLTALATFLLIHTCGVPEDVGSTLGFPRFSNGKWCAFSLVARDFARVRASMADFNIESNWAGPRQTTKSVGVESRSTHLERRETEADW